MRLTTAAGVFTSGEYWASEGLAATITVWVQLQLSIGSVDWSSLVKLVDNGANKVSIDQFSPIDVLTNTIGRTVIALKAAWSTLIGRGMSRPGSHWSRASLVMLATAILCHKEPARMGYFACSTLVLYGIRIVGFHTLMP